MVFNDSKHSGLSFLIALCSGAAHYHQMCPAAFRWLQGFNELEENLTFKKQLWTRQIEKKRFFRACVCVVLMLCPLHHVVQVTVTVIGLSAQAGVTPASCLKSVLYSGVLHIMSQCLTSDFTLRLCNALTQIYTACVWTSFALASLTLILCLCETAAV